MRISHHESQEGKYDILSRFCNNEVLYFIIFIFLNKIIWKFCDICFGKRKLLHLEMVYDAFCCIYTALFFHPLYIYLVINSLT